MNDNIKELVKRLRQPYFGAAPANNERSDAADALEAMAGEVERYRESHKGFMTLQAALERVSGERAAAIAERDRLAGEVETAKSQFKALQMVTSKEHEDTRAERDRLKNALRKKLSAKARQKLGDLSESMIAMGDGHSLEMLLNWYDESRKALGDAS